MIRCSSLLLMVFALGCGGGEPAHSPTAENKGQPEAAPARADKMSEEQAKICITEYFSRLGLSNLELVAMSQPVETPADMGAGWAYSVRLKCDSVYGDKMNHDHWLVIVGEEDGKLKVKTHYDTMAKIAASALGKEWFAKAGFSEPAGIHASVVLPMPGELPALSIELPGVKASIVPTDFQLPDLPPPPSLPAFQIPK